MNAEKELVIRIDPEQRSIRLENMQDGVIRFKQISPELVIRPILLLLGIITLSN